MEYQWKQSTIFKADPTRVGKEIKRMGNAVTPNEVLEKAKDERTELHKCFEWDDSIAGEKYRLRQAGEVLRSLVIVQEVETEKGVQEVSVRMMENVVIEDKRVYSPINHVLSDPDLKFQVMDRLRKSVMESYQIAKQYEMLDPSFAEVAEDIKKIHARLSERINRAQATV